MDMLLRDVTITELAALYERHGEHSPAPYLRDPQCVKRARRLARKNGQWEALSGSFDPTAPIPVIKRSAHREYRRTGDRGVPQAAAGQRRQQLGQAFLALWLGHPKADVDCLQDTMWAYCDDWTWVMAAHEGRAIDLGSAALGATLAEILHVLGDGLEGEVRERVRAAIEREIFARYWDYRHLDDWKTVRMNWNHVCNGEVIRAALYLVEEPRVLAHITHVAIQYMTYALDGFSADGGCEEGPGYWAYGFGHYLSAANALYHKTDGELNLLQGERIADISRYPLAAHIDGPLRSTFADASHGHIPAQYPLIINQVHPMPELYGLCVTHADRSLKLGSHHELATYQGQKAPSPPDLADYHLPDLGQVKMRGKPGRRMLTVMALAGNNGVPHNHNDVGSFLVHRGNRIWLDDPGGPTYTRKTFGPKRYDIVFCNSLGHSVPLIDGVQQRAGARYRGTLSVENLNGEGEKRAVVDMTRAYPRGTVRSLVRTLTLDARANVLTLEDAYEFSRAPGSLEEAFITYENAKVAPGGRSVQIGPRGRGVKLSAEGVAGRFRVALLTEESKEGRTDKVIRRITFTPRALRPEMCLRFSIQ